jgi:folate-dependent phosphoribosylglycinamide formyltransferase PurN
VRITVFTNNQPRHLSLIGGLAKIATEVIAIQECTTIFPGVVADFFRKSPVMQAYFSRVIAAENEVFGSVRFSPRNVRTLSIRDGDLSRMTTESLGDALQSDIYVVFGASYITGPLLEILVARRAVNIHMGVSPYYRGSSCNFWAMHDGNPQLVGATIHLLSSGLDSGPILFHALPKPEAVDPFVFGMRAARAAHHCLIEQIASGSLAALAATPQDKSKELRYTRNAEFTDEVAQGYLSRNIGPGDLERMLRSGKTWELLSPRYV